jgi:hypothetical protein
MLSMLNKTMHNKALYILPSVGKPGIFIYYIW